MQVESRSSQSFVYNGKGPIISFAIYFSILFKKQFVRKAISFLVDSPVCRNQHPVFQSSRERSEFVFLFDRNITCRG